LTLDSIRIRSDYERHHKRTKRRKQNKKEEQADQGSLSNKENLGSDWILPEDYFISINSSSEYGSTVINTTIPEEEQLLQDEEEEDHKDTRNLPPSDSPKSQIMED